MKIALNQKFEAPYESIKIVRYAKDGNTVITKKVKAQNIGNNFYATEPRDGGYGQWKLRDIYIYYPSASIGLYIECADESRVVNLPDFIDTPEGLIDHIDNLVKNDLHLAPYTQTRYTKSCANALDWEMLILGLRDIGYRGTLSFETFRVIRVTDIQTGTGEHIFGSYYIHTGLGFLNTLDREFNDE